MTRSNEESRSRRRFLKNAGVSVVALSGVPATVGAKKGQNRRGRRGSQLVPSEKEAKKQLKEKYGPKESAIIRRLTREYLRKIEKGEIRQENAYEKYTGEIVAADDTPEITEDIKSVRKTRKKLRADTPGAVLGEPVDTSGSGEGSFSTQAVGDSTSVGLGRGSKRSGSSGFCTTYKRSNPDTDNLGSSVVITASGSGYAFGRLWGRITPGRSIAGNVRIGADYFRRGGTIGCSTKISFFIRRTNNPAKTTVKKVVDSPGYANSTTTRNAQFFLARGVQYDVGIELRSSGQQLATAAVFSDYFGPSGGGRRQLDMRSRMRIRSLD